jgi:hypothetical protein
MVYKLRVQLEYVAVSLSKLAEDVVSVFWYAVVTESRNACRFLVRSGWPRPKFAEPSGRC